MMHQPIIRLNPLFVWQPKWRWACGALLTGFLSLGSAFAQDYASVSQLIAQKQYETALKQIDAAIATKPSDAQWRFLKGLAQTQSGQSTAAIDTFTKLTQEFPELPEPYNNLAVIYAQQGRLGEAKAALEAALINQPNSATANENLADVYVQLALQTYEKAQSSSKTPQAALKTKIETLRKVLPTVK